MKRLDKADLPCGGDCFNCPYDDCVVDGVFAGERVDVPSFVSARYVQKDYYLTSDYQRQYGKQYYAEHREERNDYQKRRYYENRERLLAYQKARYQAKKEQLKAYQKEYERKRRQKLRSDGC